MKVAGAIVAIVAAIALAISAYMAGSASGELTRMRDIPRLNVDNLKESATRGWVEGEAAADETSTAPVSREKVVWWQVRRTRHWEERNEHCSGSGSSRTCTTDWDERSDELDEDYSTRPLLVRGREESAVVMVGSDGIAEFVEVNDSVRKDDDSGWGGYNARDEYIETEEWVLHDGEPILVMGEVDADGSPARFSKADGLPLLVRGTFKAREARLAGKADTAKAVRTWSAGALAVGIAMLVLGLLTGGGMPFGGGRGGGTTPPDGDGEDDGDAGASGGGRERSYSRM